MWGAFALLNSFIAPCFNCKFFEFVENQRKRDDVEELFINTAAMLNNLSYYASEDSIFTSKTKELTEGPSLKCLINIIIMCIKMHFLKE